MGAWGDMDAGGVGTWAAMGAWGVMGSIPLK